MKDCLYIFLSVAMLTCAVHVSAQEKLISEVEYDMIRSKALLTIEGEQAFRTKLTVDYRESENSTWKSYSSTVSEYIRPDKSRTQLTMLYKGYPEVRDEVIRVGKSVYISRPDGRWRIDAYRKGKASVSSIVSDVRNVTIEYKNLSNSSTSEQTNVVVQKLRTTKRAVNGVTVEARSTQTDWIDAKGRLLKSEAITADPDGKPFSFFRWTTIYEIDPNIKIEAPIK